MMKLELASELIGRADDLTFIVQCAGEGKSCSLVAVSNLGKSALLRHLCNSANGPPRKGTYIYVDCNEMPERSARALFVTIWRALATALYSQVNDPEIRVQMDHLYDQMVDSPSGVAAALHFEEGIALALTHLPPPLVLCLDEFDEAYQGVEPQAFLNLRALLDRYGDAIAYVTATEREVARLTNTREQGEFYELVAPRVRFMHFWEKDETRTYCLHFAEREHVTFDQVDLDFIREQADGHPGLVQAVCYALGAVTGAPVRDEHQDRVIHQLVLSGLADNTNVQSECGKIWGDLEPDEREALFGVRQMDPNGQPPNTAGWIGLKNKSIVRDSPDGPVVFSHIFRRFVNRQQVVRQPETRGVYLDAEAGNVWVAGNPVRSLTDHEYRLLLFLYGRLGRICDKYSIVEAVWGEDYVDQVDDARIEKLVSRVRQKIEPDSAHPRYLLSLRGRGYKLVA